MSLSKRLSFNTLRQAQGANRQAQGANRTFRSRLNKGRAILGIGVNDCLQPRKIYSRSYCVGRHVHHFELIIVNDCSSDRIVEITRTYELKDRRVKEYTNETCNNATALYSINRHNPFTN